MLRTDTPIGTWLNQTSTDPAGGALSVRVRVLEGPDTYTVPTGRLSIMVTTFLEGVDTPTVNGVPLPVSESMRFDSDYPGFQLSPVVIDAPDGAVLLVVSTWRTGLAPEDDDTEPPPPPPHADALLLEDGSGAMLIEDGTGVLLLE